MTAHPHRPTDQTSTRSHYPSHRPHSSCVRQGVLIVDRDGLVIRTTLPPADAARYAANMLPLLERAQMCAEAVDGPKSKLHMLCVRTRKHEMLLCTEKSRLFSILILQVCNGV